MWKNNKDAVYEREGHFSITKLRSFFLLSPFDRISVIFRVRSAKAIKITDLDLMKRLGVIVAVFTSLLVIRTLVAPPVAIVTYTADELKAWLCKTDWWDHSFTISKFLIDNVSYRVYLSATIYLQFYLSFSLLLVILSHSKYKQACA
jgi:hypothetical protein